MSSQESLTMKTTLRGINFEVVNGTEETVIIIYSDENVTIAKIYGVLVCIVKLTIDDFYKIYIQGGMMYASQGYSITITMKDDLCHKDDNSSTQTPKTTTINFGIL